MFVSWSALACSRLARSASTWAALCLRSACLRWTSSTEEAFRLQQRLLAPLLDLGEFERRLVERELGRRDLPSLGVLRLLQVGLGRLQLGLGLRQPGLEGLLVDDEQELASLDVAPFVEMDLLEEPAHPGPDGDLLQGPRRPDRFRHDRDGHPTGLDDGDHRGRRRSCRLDLGGTPRHRDRRKRDPQSDPSEPTRPTQPWPSHDSYSR